MNTLNRSLWIILALGLCGGAAAFGQVPDAPLVDFPYSGNRTAVWVVAQLHILFAAFILGAPIFAVVAEWLGYKNNDPKYDRLAKEVIKVTVILYSMTALTGGLFIFVLLGTYPDFSTWLIKHFFLVFAVIYPLLFILETIILYTYFYSWDSMKGAKKGRHIALGILLNIVGTVTLFVIDGPTSFMNTPAKAAGDLSLVEFIQTASLWDKMANFSWMPLNLHRLVGNVTFGGFIAGLIAAYMFMGSKTDEERAYYDWMGFVGNMIGVGALLLLPFMGYLLAYELCDYDASICPYMMADQLSMFFEMQGAMVGLIFLASNYYIWLSLKRIQGVEQVRISGFVAVVVLLMPAIMGFTWKMFPPPEWQSLIVLVIIVVLPMILAKVPGLKNFTVSAFTMIKVGFLMIVVADAIWMTPHGFVPTQGLATEEVELPSWASELALMPAKNAAAFTLVFLTVVNYLLYNRAIKRGTIVWGKIDFASQFVLIFLAFSAIWTMGLMGAVRSLTRKYYHVYNLVPDFTPEAFTPTLAYSAWWITGVTIVFYAVVSFAILVTLRAGSPKPATSLASSVPVEAK
ncbi:cytochrome ubiquinol oxidase subunit I [Candidatus Nitrospira allomarina]|uniref:Cytochrome ubiquinol oxidase subunit I n=1 Tax=Candidatus Nitrospira allomarina TaxID=3020900 RepID=A0AA96GDZ3_9BACT|nr:cytochrome ubiquinol oxidase subunit I [Candidatus Nitrospira allomarina]WNM59362.1 cytochrome ubiquinol oxidase subunit I [Candidatus Nitrospira allomarina]